MLVLMIYLKNGTRGKQVIHHQLILLVVRIFAVLGPIDAMWLIIVLVVVDRPYHLVSQRCHHIVAHLVDCPSLHR